MQSCAPLQLACSGIRTPYRLPRECLPNVVVCHTGPHITGILRLAEHKGVPLLLQTGGQPCLAAVQRASINFYPHCVLERSVAVLHKPAPQLPRCVPTPCSGSTNCPAGETVSSRNARQPEPAAALQSSCSGLEMAALQGVHCFDPQLVLSSECCCTESSAHLADRCDLRSVHSRHWLPL